MSWEGWVAVVAGALALLSLLLAGLLLVRQRELRRRIEAPGSARSARALRLAPSRESRVRDMAKSSMMAATLSSANARTQSVRRTMKR